ncbi:hypothetical protein BJV82DRAFT_618244 [Fennellomyces sp. T-0311]|nr:hypothetical protein BJV82DRAFT_618244 [Fennellomyces sp. T-0311]
MLNSDQAQMQRAFKLTITDFPVDLILLITEYLDTADLKQCIFVSATWNGTFRPMLYKTVKPKDYQKFCTFYKAIEQSAKEPKRNDGFGILRVADLGCSVSTLHVQDGFLTIKRAQQLNTLCPNVTSVHFDWEERRKPLKRSARARVFESPFGFLGHFHPPSLRSLNLRLLNSETQLDSFASDIMLPMLQYLPKLESLTTNENMCFVSITFLEQLHNKCPNLRQLSIHGMNVKAPSDDPLPLFVIENVVPAETMENLSIDRFSVWADANVFNHPWWIYIARKYPSLKSLNVTSGWRQLSLVRVEHRSSQASPTVAFRDFFPQLDELVLAAFAAQYSTAWPQLVKGIRKISLRDHPTPFFSEWISHKATDSLERLSMWRFPADLQQFKNCPQLQQLELDSRTTAGKRTMMLDDFYDINLDVILSSCPALKKLTVARGQICCDGDARAKKYKSYLMTLELKSCVIASNTLLDHVGERCPKLIHLDLWDCMWIIPDQDPIIRINLWQHWLSYFRMFNARVYRQPAIRRYGRDWKQERIALCKLFMVKTPRWDENDSPLFNAGREHALFVTPFLERINNDAIVRWLNTDLDEDTYDNSTIRDNATKAIATLKSQILNSVRDEFDVRNELSSDHKECSCTVLSCGSIDRLYYGNYGEFRLFIDPKPSTS